MNQVQPKSNWRKAIFIAIGVISLTLAIATFVFVLWANDTLKADTTVYNKLIASNNQIRIKETDSQIVIEARESKASIGIIFYPGAKVEALAYANKLASILEQQKKTKLFITKPTLNLAIFGINDANKIIAENPSIGTWYLAGHSLGGAMACQYIDSNQNNIKGLILLGSYCSNNITQKGIKVLSISGSLDAFSTPQKIAAYKLNLPKDTTFYEIFGANHSQMGNYGLQPGDNTPTIDDESVKSQIKDSILNFILTTN